MTLNIPLLRHMLEQKYVQVQQHPNADLYIYNYTSKAQYERVWNDVTLSARGLITDAGYNIVARPFRKFFNLSEMPADSIPLEPFEVFEKLDGSLGILYWVGGEPAIATRGSFTGEQAVFATALLRSKYRESLPYLNHLQTYLFEIIYPANKIVVDYGPREELILLAVIDTATGRDVPLPLDSGFTTARRYDGFKDLSQLNALQDAKGEGFVIRFRSGVRAKVKFDEYIRLHRIVTGVSNLAVWEYLSEGKPLDELLERVPDEFYQWVKGVANDLQ